MENNQNIKVESNMESKEIKPINIWALLPISLIILKITGEIEMSWFSIIMITILFG